MDREKVRKAIVARYSIQPTEKQVDSIVEGVRGIARAGRRPTPPEFRNIVEKSIPSGRSQYKEASRDDSDLNDLIADIIDQAGGSTTK